MEMVRRYNAGESMRELAERYGVNPATISRTLHKHNEKAPATNQSEPGTLSDVENRQGDDTR